MLYFLLILVISVVALISYILIPTLTKMAETFSARRGKQLSNKMEQVLTRGDASNVSRFLVLAPLVFSVALVVIFPVQLRVFGLILGVVMGLLFPGIYVKMLVNKTREKFGTQLVDALMIMSSSFRGGLSLVQAIEAVVDEMPDPIKKEFGIVLGENKMGVSLEEALYHLYNRMPSPAVQQMITSILLARETGGNLPVIFQRIVTNIRETRKIQQNLDTLTIQGKIQGAVMSLLPIGFAYVVYTSNKRIFVHMFTSEIGKIMLMYAAVSWLIGVVLVMKISTFKDF
jgi:tight adherence protein B